MTAAKQRAEVKPEPGEVAAAQLCLFWLVVVIPGFAFEDALASGIVQELGGFEVAAIGRFDAAQAIGLVILESPEAVTGEVAVLVKAVVDAAVGGGLCVGAPRFGQRLGKAQQFVACAFDDQSPAAGLHGLAAVALMTCVGSLLDGAQAVAVGVVAVAAGRTGGGKAGQAVAAVVAGRKAPGAGVQGRGQRRGCCGAGAFVFWLVFVFASTTNFIAACARIDWAAGRFDTSDAATSFSLGECV